MPSNYLHKYNTDNVHARAVIIGLVNLLNSKVQFENIYSDTQKSIVTVPFYYNFGGDERFLQDYFLEWNECVTQQMVDGNVDPIPRGIVTLTSSTINTNMLTNRFIRGNYVKQVGNEVLTYNSFINPIPLTMNFEVKIVADTSLDAFKIQQAVLETFYKTQVFSVEFRGFRIPCQAGFPEDQGIEKTFEFTYQSETEISFNVPIELETYFPVTDPTTERFGGNRMNYPGGPNIEWIADEQYNLPRITIKSPTADETYFSGGKLPITWTNTGPITRINLFYRMAGATEWIPIVKNIQNSGSYVWDVPFFNSQGVKVAKEPTKVTVATTSGKFSHLRAIIDSTGSVDKIVILNGGLGYYGEDEVKVFDETNQNTISPVISPSVSGGIIVGTNVLAVGADFTPTPLNKIELKIENANNERVFAILSKTTQFYADTTESLSVIENLIPNISIPENLVSLNLQVGQPIEGAGIPQGAKIASIDAGFNTIEINAPATQTFTENPLVGATYTGNITIQ